MRKLHGFTLIELLVVIAIIAILAAILFPVFTRARAKSWEASCLSNMKQIALGMLMYTQDHDGRFPEYRYYADLGFSEGSNANNCYWHYMIEPYIRAGVARTSSTATDSHLSIWKCPGAKVLRDDGREAWYGGAYAHYAANVRVTSKTTPVKDTEIKYPSQTMMITEGYYIGASSGARRGWYLSYGYQNASSYTRYDHNGRANVAFCDGHVRGGTEGQWRDGTWKMYPDGRS